MGLSFITKAEFALSTSLIPLAAMLSFAGPAAAFDYTAVTDERLANPEPENWLQFRGNNQGWGYSALKQITPENVKRLIPAWTMSTGVIEGHESPPIVNNGVMFITTAASSGHRPGGEERQSALALPAGAAG